MKRIRYLVRTICLVLGVSLCVSLWSDPLERAIFRRLPHREITTHLSLGLQGAAMLGLSYMIPYHEQPWEVEAHFLANTDVDGPTDGWILHDGRTRE